MGVERVVVLPSALVGPGAYGALVRALGERGVHASLADLPDEVAAGADVVRAFASVIDRKRPDLAVAQSNSGLVAPIVAGDVPVVFTDAALPAQHGSTPMAPPAMLSRLESLADAGGVLPTWTEWFDEESVAGLFPDADTRADVEGGLPRLPLDYFRSAVDVPDGWESGARAYLAFGATYAGELARARALGWPVHTVEGAQHLHHLVDPGGVLRLILDLADRAQVSFPGTKSQRGHREES